MFAIEYTSSRPAGSAPYYSIVIREEPYMVGCLPINEVCLPCHDVSPQHAMLEVLRWGQAAHRTDSDHKNDSVADEVHSEHAEEVDPALLDPALLAQAPASQPSEPPRGAVLEDGEGKEGGGEEDTDPNVAAEEAANRGAATEGSAPPPHQLPGPIPLREEDPLVVRLTAMPTKGEGAIVVGGRELAPGESAIIQNGDEVQLCSEAAVVFRFRPLVVSIESTAFSAEYTRDLVYMFRRLGATLCNIVSGPASDLTSIPTPIGLLHCVEELNDSSGCVVALACGYSVVQPTYVFEWFAALAQTPSHPLSVLPAPSRFEVPVRATVHPRSTMYVRPESDTCPFSLYPIPSTAMRKRNRTDLFYGRTFYLASESSTDKYMRTITQCGGTAYAPGDEEAVKDALREMVAVQPNVNLTLATIQEEQPYPAEFYVIVDNTAEATMLNDGLRSANANLCAFMEEINALGATHVPILGDHSLFTSLLSNHFSYEPIQYSVDPPLVLPAIPAAASPSYVAHSAFTADEVFHSNDDASEAVFHTGGGRGGIQRGLVSTGSLRSSVTRRTSVTRRSSASRRRASLLPQNRGRTPSRSEMRAFNRERQRSQSLGVSKVGTESAPHPLSARTASRGRRRLFPATPRGSAAAAPAPPAASALSVGDRFDILRIRIYAFLVREEPKLDTALVNFQRTYYLDDAVVERSLQTKAQAEDYMEQVDQLLDESGYGAYTDSLRRFWRDCSDLAVKAEKVLVAFGRQAQSRKPATHRATSSYGSRKGSLSHEGNDIFSSEPTLDGSRRSSLAAVHATPTPTPATQDNTANATGAVAATAGSGSPRGAQGSRASAPSVREHRDAYLSLGGQRMSLTASQGKGQTATTAGMDSSSGGAGSPPSAAQQGAALSPEAAAAPTDDAARRSDPVDELRKHAPPLQQQGQQEQRHVDPSSGPEGSTIPSAPSKQQQQRQHQAVVSHAQRHRQSVGQSPTLVRSASRNGRRAQDAPGTHRNRSASAANLFDIPTQSTAAAPASPQSKRQQQPGEKGRVRREPPAKPFLAREGRATGAGGGDPTAQGRKAQPHSARPAWQN